MRVRRSVGLRGARGKGVVRTPLELVVLAGSAPGSDEEPAVISFSAGLVLHAVVLAVCLVCGRPGWDGILPRGCGSALSQAQHLHSRQAAGT